MTNKPQMTWIGSPKFGYPDAGTHGREGRKVVAIVHHIMQGSLAGTDSWFNSDDPKAHGSAHFGIGKDGTIHQYVSTDDAAWANGLMQRPDLSIPWLKECWDTNTNPNLLTVSIEHEGAHSTDEAGNIIAPDWEPTEAQYQASLALTRWLCEQFGITPGPNTILGHYRIDSVDRPYCPGPKFPFARMLSDLRPPSTIKPVPVHLLDGTTVQGELRSQTSWMLVGDIWLPVRQVAKAVGAAVSWHPDTEPGGPFVELTAPTPTATPIARGGMPPERA